MWTSYAEPGSGTNLTMTTPPPPPPPSASSSPGSKHGRSGSPEVIARGVWVHEGRVLVCRNLAGGYAYLPGGHVEPGETAAEALVREFDEETGQRISAGRCVMVAEVIFGQPPRSGGHELNLVFLVEQPLAGGEGPEVQSREPHIAFEWLDLAAVVDTDLRPSAIRAWLVGGGAATGPSDLFVSVREE